MGYRTHIARYGYSIDVPCLRDTKHQGVGGWGCTAIWGSAKVAQQFGGVLTFLKGYRT